MGRFRVKTALTGLLSVLAATSIFAVDALVDANEDGTNANEFESYWYYYDDNSGTKKDDRPLAAPTSKASVINVPATEKNREAFGNKADTWKVKDYTFTCGKEGTNTFAMMPFTYGESWKASYGTAAPYVGIGTMLAPDGKFIDLKEAKDVTFKMRSRVQELAVVFKIETYDITLDSTFTYYQKAITAGTDWATVTIGINETDLAQPGWTPAASEKPFAKTKVTKLAWEVPGGSNAITGDTLELDDIVITNFEFVSATVGPNTAALGSKSGIFAAFEKAMYKDASPLSTYWYAYNDASIGGNSAVTAGATENATTKLLTLAFEAGSGSDGVGYAPYLQFTLGKTIKQASATDPTATVNVGGFVGIGVNLYDSTTSSYFDATTGKRGTKGSTGTATGVYFEYLADGDFKYVTMELSDFSDVGDATTPTRKDLRGSGIVYYRNYQKTGAVWKAVSVPFTDLIVHDDWNGYKAIPLDLTKLAKLQFKVQGAEGQAGQLFVDNVCFPGLAAFEEVAVNHSITRKATSAGFTTSYQNGSVMVNWKNSSVSSGKVSMLNTKGAVVATGALNSSISAAKLPAGLYFIQFSGVDVNGKTVSQQSAVSIVK